MVWGEFENLGFVLLDIHVRIVTVNQVQQIGVSQTAPPLFARSGFLASEQLFAHTTCHLDFTQQSINLF